MSTVTQVPQAGMLFHVDSLFLRIVSLPKEATIRVLAFPTLGVAL